MTYLFFSDALMRLTNTHYISKYFKKILHGFISRLKLRVSLTHS